MSAPQMDENADTRLDEALSRPQRRLLRRIFNARTTPIVVEGSALLTYRDASRYLLSLPVDARDIAYAAIKGQALAEAR